MLLALSASVITIGGIAYLFHRAEPTYTGQEKIPGLTSRVEILRDAHGIPHIFAANRNDAALALGYIHASERMFQMEMQRRAGQGRLAEIVGTDMLGVDKFTRTLGLYTLAQSSFAAMSPDAQSTFHAYAEGVNAWITTHQDKLPPEFLLLHDTPEPWQPADSVVWGKLMALQLSHNYHLELLRAELTGKVPDEQLQWLFPMPPVGTPVTTEPNTLCGENKACGESRLIPSPLRGGLGRGGRSMSDASELCRIMPQENASPLSLLSRGSPPLPNPPLKGEGITPLSSSNQLAFLIGLDHAASNEWVIGGTRTVSGKPILANDPHLGLEAPILWYLARIVTPEGSVKGATVPGLPIVLLGQTDHLAWGFTTTGSDVQDLFVETIDPANPDSYLTPLGSATFAAHDEIIHVKNAPDVVLKVRSTRHGPVLSDIDAKMATLAGTGKVMALAFTGLGAQDRTSEALLQINQAQNTASLMSALKLYQSPPQNLTYADSDGAFGYINPGLVPVRKSGKGLIPADGASGDYDWIDTVPLERAPQIANPKAGYVFNANNAVVAEDSLDYFGQDWEEPYRARRLQQFFDQNKKQTLEMSAAMQADHLSLAAKDFLPLLLATQIKETAATQRWTAYEMLKQWDGVMDENRPEPALFEAWLYVFHNRMLAEKTGVDMHEKGPFAAMTLYELVTQHAPEWCGNPDVKCMSLIRQSFDDALDMMTKRQGADMSKWRWGQENVASLKHKLYSHIPVLKDITDLSVESSGDFYTIDRGGGFDNDAAHPFARTHGGGYRGIYDLSNADASLFMIATGESGHIFSPHYGDLVPLWKNVKAVTLSGSAESLKQNGAAELVLEP